MSRCSANQTEDAMKRAIVVTVALLASALSAHAAPAKKHVRVAHGAACHETVLGRDAAIAYAMGIASGQSAIPSMDTVRRCAPRVSNEEFERERGR
jgi:hypothetical protein